MAVTESALWKNKTTAAGESGYQIEKSLRFNDGDSPSLRKTFNLGNRRTWTINFWVKQSTVTTNQGYFSGWTANDAEGWIQIGIDENAKLYIGSSTDYLRTNRLFRDPGAWMMITVAVDTTQPTAKDRIRMYVNGELETSFGTETYPSQNALLGVNSAGPHTVGCRTNNQDGANGLYSDGYLANVEFIDGLQLSPAAFGKWGTDTNVWDPKKTTDDDGKFILPAINDGTTWSTPSYWSGTEKSGNPYDNGFDGDTSNTIASIDNSSTTGWVNYNFTPPNPITFVDRVEIHGSLTSVRWSINNEPWTTGNSAGTWDTIATGGGTITTINIEADNNYPEWRGIRIDGIVLRDGLTDPTTFTNPNNNTDWASKVTFNAGTWNANSGALSFDGSTATNNYASLSKANNGWATFSLADFAGTDKVITVTAEQTELTLNHAGGSIPFTPSDTSNVTHTFPAVTLNSSSTLKLEGLNSGSVWVLCCIKVDGVALINSSYDNSFHLKFDDASTQATLGADSLNSNTFTVSNLTHTTPTTPTVQYGQDTGDSSFDSGSTSLTKDTTGYSYSTQSSPYTDNLGNANAATVLKTADGTSVTWTVETNSSDRYLWTSSNGTNWSSSGSTYDTDGSVVQLTSAWLCWAGGSNSDAAEISWAVSGGPEDVDSLVDTPTNYGTDSGGGTVRGNYCTWNALNTSSNTLSQGNLEALNSSGAAWKCNHGTLGATSGKWYCEITLVTNGTECVGIVQPHEYTGDQKGTSTCRGYDEGGTKRWNNQNASYGNSWQTVGDTVSIAYDLDGGDIWFAINGTWQNSATKAEIEAGTNTNAAFTDLTIGATYVPFVQIYNGGKMNANFGQRAFKYTVPTGFKALCTQNLGNTFTGAAAADVNNPSKFFDAIKWKGDAATHDIFGLGFAPDFVWWKALSGSQPPYMQDRTRGFGTGKKLRNDTNAAQDGTDISDEYGYIHQTYTNGFELKSTTSDHANTNALNVSHVAWCWDAGTATSGANDEGSIDLASGAQWVSTPSGFSVTKFTASNENTFSVGHGLSNKPGVFILKTIDSTSNYWMYVNNSNLGATKALRLNIPNTPETNNMFADTEPTEKLIYSKGNGQWFATGDEIMALCWEEIPGFSSFGTYEGNDSASDGTFVYTGFHPRWLLIKSIDNAYNWFAFDTARSLKNGSNEYIIVNEVYNEGSNIGGDLDIVSNGFKWRTDGSDQNDPETYFYMAFAEHPLKTTRAR